MKAETINKIIENVDKLARKNAYDFKRVVEELHRTFPRCSINVEVKYKPRVRNEFDSYSCITPSEIYVSCPADDLILVFIHEINKGYNKRMSKSWLFENLYVLVFTRENGQWKYAESYCIDKTYKCLVKALPQFRVEVYIEGEPVLYIP